MPDFLLELRSEEIPARMQRQAAADLERLFVAELASAGLAAEAVETFVTPRRLALIARGLPAETAATSEEIKGPRTSAPAQALEGFLRKTGLRQDQLVERDGVWFATMETPGGRTADVLGPAVEAVVRGFPWPKSMRWGAASWQAEAPRWVRPLSGIVALFGGEVVDVEIAGLRSGRTTQGHRFMSSGDIVIDGADDYAAKLRAAKVIVSSEKRARIIADGARRLAEDAGLHLVEDEALVIENAGLTEWPVPLLGAFDPEFLDVPPEVIQLTAAKNQKYFVCRDAEGRLAPAFVCTANIEATDGGKAIVEGNRKVLAARLSDARFFWEQDRKQTLAEYLPKLDTMLFYEGLGTLRSKANRMAELAAHIARHYFPDAPPEVAGRAGELAKADLATSMVGEFPELQGIMGGYYAEVAGERPGLVSALKQQYLPAPEGCVPACVALADRIDTLAAFFSRGIKPTGSKDPFALRRAALQAIQTILASGARISLLSVFAKANKGLAYSSDNRGWIGEADPGELLDFFADRLKVQQREAGVRHDLIDAVFALGGEDDLVRLLARVKALQAFIGTADGENLLVGYRRAANILAAEAKKGSLPDAPATPTYAPEPAEAALITALDAAEPKAAAAVEAEDFEGAMAVLASLRAPIDAFFDGVTVNDADPAKRACRLALLQRVRAAVHQVADFSRIEG